MKVSSSVHAYPLEISKDARSDINEGTYAQIFGSEQKMHDYTGMYKFNHKNVSCNDIQDDIHMKCNYGAPNYGVGEIEHIQLQESSPEQYAIHNKESDSHGSKLCSEAASGTIHVSSDPMKYSSRGYISSPEGSHRSNKYSVVSGWLMQNYEFDGGYSIPRSIVYQQYHAFCVEKGLRPVNSACFGKVLRSVFPDIKTRRLGMRGRSRYHYCGIKSIQDVAPFAKCARKGNLGVYLDGKRSLPTPLEFGVEVRTESPAQKDFPLLCCSKALISGGSTLMGKYRDHCATLLNQIKQLEVSAIEDTIINFWRNITNESELLSSPSITECIRFYDFYLYNSIIHHLVCSGPAPVSSELFSAVRHFAKKLNVYMTIPAFMGGNFQSFRYFRMEGFKAFMKQLARYKKFAHLAQTLDSNIKNCKCMSLMLSDWETIDFNSIEYKVSWVCNCDGIEFFKVVNSGFGDTIKSYASLESWMTLAEDLVEEFLNKNTCPREFASYAKSIILKWVFYTSHLLEDLALRGASSFGYFHVLCLFLDEYVTYFIAKKIDIHYMKCSATTKEEPCKD